LDRDLWLRLHRPHHHRNDAPKFCSALAGFLLPALSPDGKLLVTSCVNRWRWSRRAVKFYIRCRSLPVLPAGFISNNALAHGKAAGFGELTGAKNHWKNLRKSPAKD
jgi:hypothetical protein